jgi:hypothetical protein
MNDAHDNAADDRAIHRRIQTDQAVEAFRKLELKRLQLEMAEYALEKLLNGRTDTDRYFTETEQIRHQMELKRADYARLGKLPRDNDARLTTAERGRSTHVSATCAGYHGEGELADFDPGTGRSSQDDWS